jgi:hypothetical protein
MEPRGFQMLRRFSRNPNINNKPGICFRSTSNCDGPVQIHASHSHLERGEVLPQRPIDVQNLSYGRRGDWGIRTSVDRQSPGVASL